MLSGSQAISSLLGFLHVWNNDVSDKTFHGLSMISCACNIPILWELSFGQTSFASYINCGGKNIPDNVPAKTTVIWHSSPNSDTRTLLDPFFAIVQSLNRTYFIPAWSKLIIYSGEIPSKATTNFIQTRNCFFTASKSSTVFLTLVVFTYPILCKR